MNVTVLSFVSSYVLTENIYKSLRQRWRHYHGGLAIFGSCAI